MTRDFSSASSAGISPVIWLPFSMSSCKLSAPPSSAGISPVSWFPLRRRKFKDFRQPKSLGTWPLRRFSAKLRLRSSESCPNSLGISPVSWFDARVRRVKAFKSPSSAVIAPSNLRNGWFIKQELRENRAFKVFSPQMRGSVIFFSGVTNSRRNGWMDSIPQNGFPCIIELQRTHLQSTQKSHYLCHKCHFQQPRQPRNWLLERSSCSKCANFLSSFGIWPLSWLSLSPRYSKASKLPSSPDSCPVRPAPTRRRFVTSPWLLHQVNFRSQALVRSASAKPRSRSTRTSTWRNQVVGCRMAWDSLRAPSGGKSSCLIGTSNLYRPFSYIALVTLAQCHLEFPPNSLAIPAWYPPTWWFISPYGAIQRASPHPKTHLLTPIPEINFLLLVSMAKDLSVLCFLPIHKLEKWSIRIHQTEKFSWEWFTVRLM